MKKRTEIKQASHMKRALSRSFSSHSVFSKTIRGGFTVYFASLSGTRVVVALEVEALGENYCHFLI